MKNVSCEYERLSMNGWNSTLQDKGEILNGWNSSLQAAWVHQARSKTSAVSATDGWLKLNFASCVVRKTRSLGARVLCSICIIIMVFSLWITSMMDDMVVDTQFHKFSVRACSMCIPHERYRSVTPLGATSYRPLVCPPVKKRVKFGEWKMLFSAQIARWA